MPLGKYFLFRPDGGASLLRLIYPVYKSTMIPRNIGHYLPLTQLNIPDYLITTERTPKLSILKNFTYLFICILN
jgi:hypothetical protein